MYLTSDGRGVWCLVVQDPFSLSKNGGLEDVSKVQKYRMSEEDYDTRKGTLREWIKKEKAKNTDWKVGGLLAF